jgi:hypothetical protein
MAAIGGRPLPRHQQTTPTPSRPDRATPPATGYGGATGKPFAKLPGGMVHPAKTTPSAIASGPADRLDNRRRMVADKPSRRKTTEASIMSSHHHLSRREPMTARAGP